MTKNDKVKFIIVGLFMLLIIAVIIGTVTINKYNKTPVLNPNLNLTLVNDYSTFFAIANDANNYIRLVGEKNNKAVYDLLNSEYIDNENITSKNIFDKVETVEEDAYLKVSDVYFQNVSDSVLYYIDGALMKSGYEEDTILNNNFGMYVLIDYNTDSYSVIPKLLEENNISPVPLNETKVEENNYNSIKSSGVIKNDTICNTYYISFYNMLASDLSKAYLNLTDEFKIKYPFNQFTNYFEQNFDLLSTTVEQCSMLHKGDKRVYTVIDGNGNEFVFFESSILHYQIEFSLNN